MQGWPCRNRSDRLGIVLDKELNPLLDLICGKVGLRQIKEKLRMASFRLSDLGVKLFEFTRRQRLSQAAKALVPARLHHTRHHQAVEEFDLAPLPDL